MQPFVIPVGEPIDDPVPKGWALRSLGTWKGQGIARCLRPTTPPHRGE